MNSQLISNVCTDALSAEKVRCAKYHPNISFVWTFLWTEIRSVVSIIDVWQAHNGNKEKHMLMLLKINSVAHLFNLNSIGRWHCCAAVVQLCFHSIWTITFLNLSTWHRLGQIYYSPRVSNTHYPWTYPLFILFYFIYKVSATYPPNISEFFNN